MPNKVKTNTDINNEWDTLFKADKEGRVKSRDTIIHLFRMWIRETITAYKSKGVIKRGNEWD